MGNQVILGHHALAILDQVKQEVEDLRLDGHRLATAQQLTPDAI
jgi:hypothetical protein